MFHPFCGCLCFGSVTSILYDCGQVCLGEMVGLAHIGNEEKECGRASSAVLRNKTAWRQGAGPEFPRSKLKDFTNWLLLLRVLAFFNELKWTLCAHSYISAIFFSPLFQYVLLVRLSLIILLWHCASWMVCRKEELSAGRWEQAFCSRGSIN